VWQRGHVTPVSGSPEVGERRSLLPLMDWVRTYQRRWLWVDIVAGLTVWALLIPEGLAYATLAGMPPATLFATAPIALLVYAVLGSSRRMIVSVSSAVATMSAATVSALGVAPLSARWIELTVELALLTGVLALLAGILRLGFVAEFISAPVQTGFLAGLAITICVKVAPAVLGLPAGHGNVLPRVAQIVTHLGDVNGATIALSVVAAVLVLAPQRFAPRVPGAFLALVFGIVAVRVLGLTSDGVAVVGHIPGGLPHPSLPHASVHDLVTLLPGAAGLLLVAYAEAIGTARGLGDLHHEEVDRDQELVALGVANTLVGFFGGYPAGTSLSKSAANNLAGARSQVSGVVAAVLALLTAASLAAMFTDLPESVLGVVVILAVRPLLRVAPFIRYARLQPVELLPALAALTGVVVLGLLPGLIIAVGLSILVLVFRSSRPRLAVLGRNDTGQWVDTYRVPGAEVVPGLLVVRVDAVLFYANARLAREGLRALAARKQARCVVLDLEESETLDVTAVESLAALVDDLTGRGIELRLARVRSPALDLIRRSGVADAIGMERIFSTIPSATADFDGSGDP